MKTFILIMAMVAVGMAADAKVTVPDGKALSAKCVACHGTSFEKVALGKSVIVKGQKAEAIEASLVAYKAGTQNKHGMGALMKGQLASMSPADIKALSVYIASIK